MIGLLVLVGILYYLRRGESALFFLFFLKEKGVVHWLSTSVSWKPSLIESNENITFPTMWLHKESGKGVA